MDTKHALKGILLFGGLTALGFIALVLYTSFRTAPPPKTVFERAGERARASAQKHLLH